MGKRPMIRSSRIKRELARELRWLGRSGGDLNRQKKALAMLSLVASLNIVPAKSIRMLNRWVAGW